MVEVSDPQKITNKFIPNEKIYQFFIRSDSHPISSTQLVLDSKYCAARRRTKNNFNRLRLNYVNYLLNYSYKTKCAND